MDKKESQTNQLKNKKIVDHAQDLTPERWYIQILFSKKRRIRLDWGLFRYNIQGFDEDKNKNKTES